MKDENNGLRRNKKAQKIRRKRRLRKKRKCVMENKMHEGLKNMWRGIKDYGVK